MRCTNVNSLDIKGSPEGGQAVAPPPAGMVPHQDNPPGRCFVGGGGDFCSGPPRWHLLEFRSLLVLLPQVRPRALLPGTFSARNA
jgi:hypothetical protein